jgi:hypothetical protein
LPKVIAFAGQSTMLDAIFIFLPEGKAASFAAERTISRSHGETNL